MTDELKTFICVFCHYRSQKKNFGCPHCGRPFGYGEERTMKAIQLAHAAVFTLIGGMLILLGVKILINELRLPYEIAPWWVFAVIFGFGGLLAMGGLSSFFGNSWLLRLLFLLFARNNLAEKPKGKPEEN